MNLIGKPAPEFTATAIVDGQVVRDFSLASYRDRYVVERLLRDAQPNGYRLKDLIVSICTCDLFTARTTK